MVPDTIPIINGDGGNGGVIVDPNNGNNNNGNNNNGNNNNGPQPDINNGNAMNEEAQQNTTKMIVGVVVGGTCLVCLAVVSTVFYMRKKAKIGQIAIE